MARSLVAVLVCICVCVCVCVCACVCGFVACYCGFVLCNVVLWSDEVLQCGMESIFDS